MRIFAGGSGGVSIKNVVVVEPCFDCSIVTGADSGGVLL